MVFPHGDLSVGAIDSLFQFAMFLRENHQAMGATDTPNAILDVKPSQIDCHAHVVWTRTNEGLTKRLCGDFGQFEVKAPGDSIRFRRPRGSHNLSAHLVHIQHGGAVLFAHVVEGEVFGARPSRLTKFQAHNIGIKSRKQVTDSKERCKVEPLTL